MCGIAGGQHKKSFSEEEIRQFTRAQGDLAHRGPDGHQAEIFPDKRNLLFHHRLAIVGLGPSANQPMWDDERQYCITFNGEIYNWRDFLPILAEKGVTLRANSDTEVLLHLLIHEGVTCLSKLRGTYALAFFNILNSEFILARDPVGEKPLYYASTSEAVYFASEIRVLHSLPWVDSRIDEASLASMMLHSCRHITEPHTLYQGIHSLRPGHYIRISEGKLGAEVRHWAPKVIDSVSATKTLRKCFEEAVAMQLQADVPVGALLSGGFDSTAVTAFAKRICNGPLHTYAFGFNENDEDLCRARKASKTIGTIHKEFFLDPNLGLDTFDKLLQIHGQPLMLLPLCFATVMAKAIRDDGIRVVLTGTGADELFLGYTGHLKLGRISDALDRAKSILPPLARIMEVVLPRSPLRAALANPTERKAMLYNLAAAKTWKSFMPDSVISSVKNYAAEECRRWSRLAPDDSLISESILTAIQVENYHSLSLALDLPGMVHGVEFRAPFLDKELIDVSLSISARKKLTSFGQYPVLKGLLREALSDLVPKVLADAPKRGFGHGISEAELLRGPWRDALENSFANLPKISIFCPRKCQVLLDRFLSGCNTESGIVARLFSVGRFMMQSQRESL